MFSFVCFLTRANWDWVVWFDTDEMWYRRRETGDSRSGAATLSGASRWKVERRRQNSLVNILNRQRSVNRLYTTCCPKPRSGFLSDQVWHRTRDITIMYVGTLSTGPYCTVLLKVLAFRITRNTSTRVCPNLKFEYPSTYSSSSPLIVIDLHELK